MGTSHYDSLSIRGFKLIMKNLKVLDNRPKQLTIKLKTRLKAEKGISGESRIFQCRLTHCQFEITCYTLHEQQTRATLMTLNGTYTREGRGIHGSRWLPRKCQFIKFKHVLPSSSSFYKSRGSIMWEQGHQKQYKRSQNKGTTGPTSQSRSLRD